MKLDRNSYGTVALVLLISALLIFVLLRFVEPWWVKWPLVAFVWAICIWQTAFHIVPDRHNVGTDKDVCAVADGKIVFIGTAYEKEFLKRDCTMISIYMDFWDVHANFWPIDGEVAYFQYHPGKHFLAFKPKASEENEHTCTCLRNASGDEIFFKQLAGGFARRIVNYAREGVTTVSAGKQCGIIKFGSRIDMFLPLDAKIEVSVGETVRACETLVARLS